MTKKDLEEEIVLLKQQLRSKNIIIKRIRVKRDLDKMEATFILRHLGCKEAVEDDYNQIKDFLGDTTYNIFD